MWLDADPDLEHGQEVVGQPQPFEEELAQPEIDILLGEDDTMDVDLEEAERLITLSPKKSSIPVSLVRPVPRLQEPSTSAVQSVEGLDALESSGAAIKLFSGIF